MAVTPGNLAGGPGTLYYGAFSLTAAQEPFDFQVNGTPAASAWTDLGGTLGGLKLGFSQSYQTLDVDQISETPERRRTKKETTFSTQLAEVTAANLAIAIGGGAVTTGAGFAAFDPGQDTGATLPTYGAILFDGSGPGGKRRRVALRKVLSTANVDEEFSETAQNVIPVTFTSHYVSSTVASWRYVDSTT